MSASTSAASTSTSAAAASAQLSELVFSDLDLAFNLQLQEAITASLSLQNDVVPPQPPKSGAISTSSRLQNDAVRSSSQLQYDAVSSLSHLQIAELEGFETSHLDKTLAETETRNSQLDFLRRIHDERFAREIQHMLDEDWDEFGDDFERPYGEGTSKNDSDEVFRVYFKGFTSDQKVGDSTLYGIGVAVCDSRNEVVFEVRKPVSGKKESRVVTEGNALVEALNVVAELGLKRITLFCHYYPLYQYVTERWMPKQQKIAALVNQVNLLRQKFTYSKPVLVSRKDVKFAFKLAREAIVSQMNKTTEPNSTVFETCVICLEDTPVNQFFSVDGCNHRYCFSCMKQHVEVKLLHGMVPKCPSEGCKFELKIGNCEKFLTPKLLEMMRQRLKEASIPVTEKIYCPYPKCSVLMSKAEVLSNSRFEYPGIDRAGRGSCIKCGGHFCINCKVPWHNKMTCTEYKRRNPVPAEDAKLNNLAARNLWRQCVKCKHMIELAAGCYHMTCRCGYEFCYTCGAEWKNKKQTCACPLWDEGNIWDEDSDSEDYDAEQEFLFNVFNGYSDDSDYDDDY